MSESKSASTGLIILSFLFPIVGWILYFVKKSENIGAAKTYAKWGWAGFGLGLILRFIAEVL